MTKIGAHRYVLQPNKKRITATAFIYTQIAGYALELAHAINEYAC